MSTNGFPMFGGGLGGSDQELSDKEKLQMLIDAADSDYAACETDLDFAGLYVISCQLDGSSDLDEQQAAERLRLHYVLKDAREKRFPSEEF